MAKPVATPAVLPSDPFGLDVLNANASGTSPSVPDLAPPSRVTLPVETPPTIAPAPVPTETDPIPPPVPAIIIPPGAPGSASYVPPAPEKNGAGK